MAEPDHGCGGVVCGHNIDAWMSPSRRGATRAAAQWVGGFGWLSQHAWEHYVFSGDEAFWRRRSSQAEARQGRQALTESRERKTEVDLAAMLSRFRASL